MSEASPPTYDPVELRRRIVVCFSVPELKQLADSLGVGGSITWERGAAEAVRDMVRQAERYSGLEVLVAKLRELRPEVEWPEPAVAAAAPKTIAGVPLQVVEGLAAPGADGAVGAASASNPSTAPNAPSGAGERPPLFAESAEAPATKAPLAAPMWPGTVDPSRAPPPRGLDARLLVLVAALTVAAAVIAYLAGRSASAPQAAAPEGETVAARRAEGPATRAADAMSRSMGRVARACEIAAGPEVFKRVFERCGPVPPATRVRAPGPSPNEPHVGDGSDARERDRDRERPPEPPGEPARKRQQRGADPGDPPAARPGGGGCIGRCDADHRACKSNCGPEPTDASRYDGYQQCLSRCLSAASRCRLACQ